MISARLINIIKNYPISFYVNVFEKALKGFIILPFFWPGQCKHFLTCNPARVLYSFVYGSIRVKRIIRWLLLLIFEFHFAQTFKPWKRNDTFHTGTATVVENHAEALFELIKNIYKPSKTSINQVLLYSVALNRISETQRIKIHTVHNIKRCAGISASRYIITIKIEKMPGS